MFQCHISFYFYCLQPVADRAKRLGPTKHRTRVLKIIYIYIILQRVLLGLFQTDEILLNLLRFVAIHQFF